MTTGNPIQHPVGEKCTATSKQTGERCGQPAGFGTDHVGFGLCKYHGGLSPGGKVQAERLRATWLARLEAEIDPSLTTVVGLRDDVSVEPRTRLAAANSLLDRAGVKSEDGVVAPVEVVVRWPERA